MSALLTGVKWCDTTQPWVSRKDLILTIPEDMIRIWFWSRSWSCYCCICRVLWKVRVQTFPVSVNNVFCVLFLYFRRNCTPTVRHLSIFKSEVWLSVTREGCVTFWCRSLPLHCPHEGRLSEGMQLSTWRQELVLLLVRTLIISDHAKHVPCEYHVINMWNTLLAVSLHFCIQIGE